MSQVSSTFRSFPYDELSSDAFRSSRSVSPNPSPLPRTSRSISPRNTSLRRQQNQINVPAPQNKIVFTNLTPNPGNTGDTSNISPPRFRAPVRSVASPAPEQATSRQATSRRFTPLQSSQQPSPQRAIVRPRAVSPQTVTTSQRISTPGRVAIPQRAVPNQQSNPPRQVVPSQRTSPSHNIDIIPLNSRRSTSPGGFRVGSPSTQQSRAPLNQRLNRGLSPSRSGSNVSNLNSSSGALTIGRQTSSSGNKIFPFVEDMSGLVADCELQGDEMVCDVETFDNGERRSFERRIPLGNMVSRSPSLSRSNKSRSDRAHVHGLSSFSNSDDSPEVMEWFDGSEDGFARRNSGSLGSRGSRSARVLMNGNGDRNDSRSVSSIGSSFGRGRSFV